MLKQVVKRIVAVAAMTTIVAFGSEAAFAEQTKLSNGVTYEQTETTYNGKPQVMNELTVDLKDPYTEVRVHYPFDILCGSILGIIIGLTSGYLFNRFVPSFFQDKQHLTSE